MEREFNRVEWELSERRNNFNVLTNRSTGKFCEEYILSNITEDDKNLWIKRYKIQHQDVLSVIGCEIFSGLNSAHQFSRYSMRVYMDSTIQRLSELRSVTINDEQELILPVLRGFEKLCQEYGPFRVHPSYIGLTIQRECKVWFSPNFLQNKLLEADRTSETEMVSSILKLFKRLYSTFPQNKGFKETLEIAADIKTHYIPRRKPISDLISVINKTDFEGRTSYQAETANKYCFSKKEKVDQNTIRDTIKVLNSPIEADQHRKTAKNVNNLSHIFSPPKVQDIRVELFNPQKSQEEKLALVEEVIAANKESGDVRLCILYRYSLHNDKEMFQELERVKGKLVSISDIKILLRISEVVEKEFSNSVSGTSFKKVRSPRISLLDLERMKKEIIGDPSPSNHGPPTLSKGERIQEAKLMKDEAEKLLFG